MSEVARDVLLTALRGGATSRPAWVPFVGVHGGALLGISASDYLQSSDRLVEGLCRAYELYKPDGLPVAFDLQIEAEILGCELKWAEQTPPSVVTHPMAGGIDPDALPTFSAEAGRMPVVLEATRQIKAKLGEQIGIYGLICGPFTLAMHLRGNELFLDMFDHEDDLQRLMAFTAAVARQAATAYLEAGADVVAVVDPMTSQISPEHFMQFVTPAINSVFDHIREKRGLSSLFVCGDASRNLEVMADTTCDNVSIDENICLETLRGLMRDKRKSFGGNLKLTTVLLMGNADDARLDAIRCIDIGGRDGFVLAPGCDLPYAVPAENLQAVTEMVHSPYQRQVARTTITAESAVHFEDVELPDYEQPMVIVDVVTLDSAACAPCQYMVEAVRRAAKQTDGAVKVYERKISTREGVGMMMKLGVSAIPTICIDGKPVFSSVIPTTNELVDALETRALEKAS
jgi:uroporphyrinogen decarboxylase